MKINAFHLNKNGEPQPNGIGRAGDMSATRQVDKICSAIFFEYLSATKQVLAV